MFSSYNYQKRVIVFKYEGVFNFNPFVHGIISNSYLVIQLTKITSAAFEMKRSLKIYILRTRLFAVRKITISSRNTVALIDRSFLDIPHKGKSFL